MAEREFNSYEQAKHFVEWDISLQQKKAAVIIQIMPTSKRSTKFIVNYPTKSDLIVKPMKNPSKKIDIFVAHTGPGKKRYFSYAASTNRSETCKDAKQKFYEANYPKIALADIKCSFADRPTKTNPVKRKKTAHISRDRANKEKYVRRPSQITTYAPSKRLQARRKSTLKAPKGYFANPCGKKTVKKNPIEKTYRVEYRTHSGAGWQIVARFPHTETGRKHAREYAEALFEKHDGKYPVKVVD